jgi:hypothetical protein
VTSRSDATGEVCGNGSVATSCAGRVEALEGLAVNVAGSIAVEGVEMSRGDEIVTLLYLPKNCLVFSLWYMNCGMSGMTG